MEMVIEQRVRVILTDLVAHDPYEFDGWQQDLWCVFCGVKWNKDESGHEETCVWRRAKEVLA